MTRKGCFRASGSVVFTRETFILLVMSGLLTTIIINKLVANRQWWMSIWEIYGQYRHPIPYRSIIGISNPRQLRWAINWAGRAKGQVGKIARNISRKTALSNRRFCRKVDVHGRGEFQPSNPLFHCISVIWLSSGSCQTPLYRLKDKKEVNEEIRAFYQTWSIVRGKG